MYKPKNQTTSPLNPTHLNNMNEQQLLFRLVTLVIAFFVIGGTAVAGVLFFGPQIGGFFGLISVNRDTGKPTKDVTAPDSPIIYDFPEATKESTVSVKGYAEAGSTVKIFVNGPEAQSVVADSTGQFTFTDLNLIEGKNTITAKAIDGSNNESTNSKEVYINVDTEKPTITLDTPKDGDTVRNLNKSVYIKGKVSE